MHIVKRVEFQLDSPIMGDLYAIVLYIFLRKMVSHLTFLYLFSFLLCSPFFLDYNLAAA